MFIFLRANSQSRIGHPTVRRLTFVRSVVLVLWNGRLVRSRGCRWRGCFTAWKRVRGCLIIGRILASIAEFMMAAIEVTKGVNCIRACYAETGIMKL